MIRRFSVTRLRCFKSRKALSDVLRLTSCRFLRINQNIEYRYSFPVKCVTIL